MLTDKPADKPAEKPAEKPVNVKQQMMEDLFGAWLTLETAKVFASTSAVTMYCRQHEGNTHPKYQLAVERTQELVRRAALRFDKVWRAIEDYMRRSATLLYCTDTDSAFSWLQEKIND